MLSSEEFPPFISLGRDYYYAFQNFIKQSDGKMDENEQIPGPPKYDPAGELKSKLIFFAVVVALMLIGKFGFGW